jgi:hypothetical protein
MSSSQLVCEAAWRQKNKKDGGKEKKTCWNLLLCLVPMLLKVSRQRAVKALITGV